MLSQMPERLTADRTGRQQNAIVLLELKSRVEKKRSKVTGEARAECAQ
jgi:hypothetical protein